MHSLPVIFSDRVSDKKVPKTLDDDQVKQDLWDQGVYAPGAVSEDTHSYFSAAKICDIDSDIREQLFTPFVLGCFKNAPKTMDAPFEKI